nr:putative methyltransferase NSUN7 [Misgurnus anguillicaudatus]
MPHITSLNLPDQESAPKNKVHAPSSPKGPTEKICTHSLKKLATVPLVRNVVRMEREKAHLGFPDSVYSQAAAIFQKTHAEKDLVHGLNRGFVVGGDAGAKQNEHWAYDLAFNALKYQDLLEDILTDSLFYRSQQIPDDLMALVMVLLYDLLNRKFQPREPMKKAEGGLIKEVRQVEDSLYRFKTKLDACLAHCRIKQNLITIDNFLPQDVRGKHRRKQTLPLYAWINTLKASIENVCEVLKTEGFTRVDSHAQLLGNVFCKDRHCSNVLLFPRSVQKRLEKSKLVTEYTLIIQDKSRSLVACAVRPLLAEKSDVLMVGSFSALTVAHVAVQVAARSGCVRVCGVFNPILQEEIQTMLSSIGCTNVKLMPDDFHELNEWDSRIQKVQVIVLLPQCSASALCNPVEFILNENGDRGLLHGLSKGSISDSKLQELVAKQTHYLSRALTSSKVKAVVYCTCSVYPEENELLVKRALEKAESKAKALPFRLVSAGWGDRDDKFFKTEASDSTNGCFLCVMKRGDPAEVETVQDILARAAAKGLLGGLMPPDPLNGEKQKKRKKQKDSSLAPPSFSLIKSITPVKTSLSPEYDILTASVRQTETIQNHTSLNHSPIDQISVMDGTFSSTKPSNVQYQASNEITQYPPVQKNQSKPQKPHTKAPKQSRRKKTSKSHTNKERQSRTHQPSSKKLLHLRPSQHTTAPPKPTSQTKSTALRTPASTYSRAVSQESLISLQEVLNPKQEVIASKVVKLEKEFSLPPVSQLSRTHLSSSFHRMYSSTSNFSTPLSSTSSIGNSTDSMVSHSRA